MKREDLMPLMSEIFELYGFDFRNYAKASLMRRVNNFCANQNISYESLAERLKSSEKLFAEFIDGLTVQVTEMFRDPEFYIFLKQQVFPHLATYHRIKIWHAGCSTGEEVFSMAIMLHEAGLLERSMLYGTDINQESLQQARKGLIPLRRMKDNSKNYSLSQGSESLLDYYSVNFDYAEFSESIRKRILFSFHNLVSDESFGEFHLILCRNVLIYFDSQLQDRALSLFDTSLVPGGFLGVGAKEQIDLMLPFQV